MSQQELTKENFNISPIPDDAMNEINKIETRQRYNQIVKTGSPSFIPQGFFDLKSEEK